MKKFLPSAGALFFTAVSLFIFYFYYGMKYPSGWYFADVINTSPIYQGMAGVGFIYAAFGIVFLALGLFINYDRWRNS